LKQIGILGGSFNPIHKGHLHLARELRKIAGLNEVWLMVSPQNPFKEQSELLADEQRLRMVQMAVAKEEGIVACDYEFHLPRPSYTWNTLQHLREEYPDATFSLLIGGDNWINFSRWYKHEEILRNYHIIVYPRKGSDIDETKSVPNVSFVHLPLINVSSTQIRELIRHGRSVRRWVPKVVADYIEQERFYK